MNPWIQTFTGAKHDLLNPDPWDIRLSDITHALSLICRFTGHVREHYSVAQHSVLVARLLRDEGHNSGIQAQGLLHDAHEAYVGDVASPIKRAIKLLIPVSPIDRILPDFSPWSDLERRHEHAVRARFGCALDLSPAVKRADLVLLMTEARDLMGAPPEPWDIPAKPALFHVTPWTAERARREFLDEAERLDVR